MLLEYYHQISYFGTWFYFLSNILKVEMRCYSFISAWKIIISVLVALRLIFFSLNHLFIRFRSCLMNLFIFLSDFFANRRLASSAKRRTLLCMAAWCRSFIKIINNRGPRTEPWWTPWEILLNSEFCYLFANFLDQEKRHIKKNRCYKTF